MSSTLAAILVAATAQAPSPAPTPPPRPHEYTVGSGDVLDVVVIDNAELTRTPTVQTNGAITLPLLGEVQVAGLTVLEIQRKLTTLLERDFLVNPQVEVRVREYQSQFVMVLGEVNAPGRKVLRGKVRLMDLLIEAGGIRPSASGEVAITRTEGAFDNGQETLRVHIGGSAAMSPLDRINLDISLRNGDLINVLPKNHVTVEGEVTRPGRYSIDGNSTLTAIILDAGGLTRYGSNNMRIRRIEPKTGKVEILKADLKAIRNGKQPDVPLQPNDTVSVPRRRF